MGAPEVAGPLHRAVVRERLKPGIHRVRVYEGELLLHDVPFTVGDQPSEVRIDPK